MATKLLLVSSLLALLNTLLFDVERIRDFLVTMSSLSTYLITVIFITTTSNVPVHFCR